MSMKCSQTISSILGLRWQSEGYDEYWPAACPYVVLRLTNYRVKGEKNSHDALE